MRGRCQAVRTAHGREVAGASEAIEVLGGTCALRGCDPKTMLIGGVAALDHARRMSDKGTVGDVKIDWRALMEFKRGFTDPIPEKQEQRFQEKGVDAYHGQAKLTGTNTLEVNGQSLEGKQILIATGAEPIKLGIPGEEYLLTNEDFLARETLPKKIVLVGGGYIAAELSNIAARAGAEVIILQRGERMLTHFEPELVEWLMESFESTGIDVHTNTTVNAIEKVGDGFRVRASQSDKEIEVENDWVVHAAGRAPALEALNLSAAEVAVEHGRLKLNDYLQSV